MALYAIDDIDDAFAATKELLLPFDLGLWFRLTVVVFFIGGAGLNFPTGNFGGMGGEAPPPDGIPDGVTDGLPEVTDAVLTTLVAVAVLIVLLALVWMILASVMEFVLVESLRAEEVHVRRYFRRYAGKGLRLFGFRLVLGLVALAILLLPLAAAVLAMGGLDAIDSVADVLALVFLGLSLAFVVGVGHGLVSGFTTVFVVPVMVLEDRGVLSAWSRFWTTLRGEWKQYLVYVGIAVVLHLIAGVAVATLVGIAGLLLFVPLLVGVGAVFLAAGPLTPFGLAVIVFFGLAGLLVFLLVVAVLQVPVVTFFRYYGLLVLGDTDGDLDLVPERRAAIRDSA